MENNNNIPIFDTSKLNKAFSCSLGNASFSNEQKGSSNGFKNPVKEPTQSQPQAHPQHQPPTQVPQSSPIQQKSQPTSQIPEANQQGQNNNNQNSMNGNSGLGQFPNNQAMGGSFGLGNNSFNPLYNNLTFGNASLSNYLNTVKGNNSGLY